MNIAPHSSGIRINISESIIGGIVATQDALVTFFSGLFVLWFYTDMSDVDFGLYGVAFALTTYTVVHTLQMSGLYKFSRIVTPGSQFLRIAGACAMGFLLLIALAFAFKVSASLSRVWAVAWAGSAVILIQLGRLAVASLIAAAARRGILTHRIALFGTNDAARKLLTDLSHSAQPWNQVIGIFDDRTDRVGPAGEVCAVTGDLDDLLDTARRQRVDEIFVTLPWAGPNNRIDDVLRRLSVLPARINLHVSDNLAKYLCHDVNTDSGIPVIPVYERPITGWQALIKRAFDLMISSLCLLLAFPALAIIAIAIKLDSPGPIFFRQDRFGFNNELIPVWKFRTMYRDQTDKNAERLATMNDPRITRVGHFLRRTSLDELPQLFNVLNGSMSLVGPRPHATRAKAAGRLYQEVIESYGSRHRVKPGITGWAQVNGWRGETDTDEKIIKRVEHDLYYISHWSLRLDVLILLKTVRVVLKGDNAY